MKNKKDVNYYYDKLTQLQKATQKSPLLLVYDDCSEPLYWAIDTLDSLKYDSLTKYVTDYGEEFEKFIVITDILNNFCDNNVYSMFDLHRFAIASDCFEDNVHLFVLWLCKINTVAQEDDDIEAKNKKIIKKKIQSIIDYINKQQFHMLAFRKTMPDYELTVKESNS